MKKYVLYNSDDGFIVQQVDGRNCKYCIGAFIYKRDDIFYLIDEKTGLSITCAKHLKDLEENFNYKKETYETVKKSDTYNIKSERFEKLKVAYHMKGIKI